MEHSKVLDNLCRVCGKAVQTKSAKVKHSCTQHTENLMRVFGISIDHDEPDMHPQHFCHPCHLIIHKALTKSYGEDYKHRTSAYDGWCRHVEGSCRVCEHYSKLQKGGRPKKVVRTGRPPSVSPRYCGQHVREIAPAPLVEPATTISICQTHQAIDPSQLHCPLCCGVLLSPIELVTCGSLVCAQCCCRWLNHCTQLTCPCCYHPHITDFSTIRPASPLILNMLGSLCVVCEKCDHHLRLDKLKEHLASNCRTYSTPASSPDSVKQILSQPMTTPLTPLEQKLQTSLVKRSLTTSSAEKVLQLRTRGQPMTLVQVRQPRVPSGKARPSTIRERSHCINNLRQSLSAGDTAKQLTHELRTCNADERQMALEELGGSFRVHIPAEMSLALKADLNIPWSKLRTMRRWLDMWGVAIDSEKKMRKEAKLLIGDNLKAELAPFSFKHRDGGEVIQEAPMVYIPNLWMKIKDQMDQNSDEARRINRITWHQGAIPEDEMWLKLGGDKGGGTFKMCFQLLNVPSPNASENTCAFTMFEAPDTYTNLQIGLQRYADVFKEIESQTWRGRRMKVFLCGDYEFLCRMFGLSGASGRHCCLWCLITQEQLKLPPSTRGPVTARTTKSISEDHEKFVKAGANPRNAKHYNNCICKPFFPSMSLSQVCPPGLHITLGIFLRLFVLLEDACHRLDLTAELHGSVGGRSFERYSATLRQQRALKDEEHSINNEVAVLEQTVTYTMAVNPNVVSLPIFQQLTMEIATRKRRLQQLKAEIAALESTLKQGFHKDEGPFVTALDKALASFNVHRQAYYSGTFVGNHVHRALKTSNIDTLCCSVVDVAQRHCPAVVPQATEIESKFKKVFTLFRNCHKLYDSGVLNDSEISELDTNINRFMSFYREAFPEATVLPKMHFLEEHVVPWLKKWKIGFGFMGEQGAESIHAYFNSLHQSYRTIPDPVQRMEHTMREHFLHIAPANVAAKPAIKRRKLNQEE